MSYLQKYVPKETKDIDVKAFNMITNKNEAKAMTEHISCGCKCKFNSPKCNSKQKLNNKTCQCECKNYRKCKKDYSWNPSSCICENSNYLKSIDNTSVTECDAIVNFIDIVSTKKANTIASKKTNTIATNAMSTASITCLSKNVRDCYILRTVLLVIMLHFAYSFISHHFTVVNYYYLLSLCKTKRYNIKWKIMSFKKFVLRIICVIISMTYLN